MAKEITVHTMTRNERELVDYVMGHLMPWKDHRIANYETYWNEYERLYRGVWANEDKGRQSERARIVSPAIQQAVDSRIAELSEAVLARNEFFDIDDDVDPPQQATVQPPQAPQMGQQGGMPPGMPQQAPAAPEKPDEIGFLRRKMGENFKKDKMRKSIHDVMQLGEIYGTGVGEIVLKKVKEQAPAKAEMMPGIAAVGVKTRERISVKLHPVHPRNFIPDPNESDLDDSLGYGIEEKVSLHSVVEAMAKEEYKFYNLMDTSGDSNIEPDGIAVPYRNGTVVIYRWYGKVPREYLENLDKDEEPEEKDGLQEAIDNLGNDEYEDYSDMVDAIIHIAEGSHLLKAEKNPYMMGDRCCVVYRPQTLAGRFWGIGTVEKGYNMQKSLDGQIRAHLDSIGITASPMFGIDAARMPRGFDFKISPGRSVPTNGNPSEIIQPLNMGQPSPVNIETAQLFERMLQQATGTIDSSGLPQQVGNQADAGGMAIALSGIIKKHKLALLNFQEDFLIPLITRAAYRFMQFDPDNFPVKDWNFIPASTMGIMAREYEQQQMIGLMQTLGPESPIVPMLLKGIIENSSLSNREELAENLQKMSQPDPAQQQMQQQQQQMQVAMMQAQLEAEQAKAANLAAEAEYHKAKAAAVPLETQAKLAASLATNLDDQNEGADFERRAKITELMLKEKDLALKEADIKSNHEIAAMQMHGKAAEVQTKAAVERMKIERDKQGNLTVTKSKE